MAIHPQAQEIKEQLALLPSKPGVYQYFNEKDEVIYVGKAKNLKKRVSSYFQKEHYESAKIRVMVSRIRRLEYIVVETESDALLLENNLIKKYQPRYNVLLKDDKTFPWICIKNEPFPRVFSTRKIVRDGSQYYGPYTSAHMVRVLIDLIRQLYPLRTCNYNLTRENIDQGKFKACLEYHIGNCKAPCEGKQSVEDYQKAIENIQKILKGNIQEVITYLKALMKEHAETYAFEEADQIRQKLELLERFKSKSTVVSASMKDADVFSILDDNTVAFVNFIKVVDGRIVQAHTVELKKRLSETQEQLLETAVIEIRERLHSHAPEVILPIRPEFDLPGVKVVVPQRGDKKKLLELSQRNLHYYRLEKKKKAAQKAEKHSSKRVLEKIKKDLNLPSLPVHMECFDNSNIQGTTPVAACVVFRNAKPKPSEYRHFHVKTVEGANDFASMEEVVYRRYKRLLEEERDLPQLVIIDGGKGQLSAAVNALKELKIMHKTQVIGIAKRLEEIFFPGDPIPVYLDKTSESLKVIQHIRNEAHRFGISFHRNVRSKNFIGNELEKIEGIGQRTAESLLKKYKSVEEIKHLSHKELTETLGQSKGSKVYSYFHPREKR